MGLQKSDASSVLSPMPCKVTKVLVKPGQKVEKDQPLVALEAMKMEVLCSPEFFSSSSSFFFIGFISSLFSSSFSSTSSRRHLPEEAQK